VSRPRSRAALLALLAGLVAGCGGGGHRTGSLGTDFAAQQQAALAGGHRGGRLTQLGSGVDFVDPGRTYYGGFQVAYATQRTLYGFKPGDGADPVPDLAAAEPEISADRTTVTVSIRPGVRFGPPVNREVTSRDVKYAFERFFSRAVRGQYAFYFDALVGAPRRPTDGVRDIPGIVTPDDRTIVFRLDRPVGESFAAALVMPITAPVPAEYARRFDRSNPSTYDRHVVATGPYMVRNDTHGDLVGYRRGRSITLVRNPSWNGPRTGDYRPAYLDRIVLRTGGADANVAARDVLEGHDMVLAGSPPLPVLQDVVENVKGQYAVVPSGGYRYFPMNTAIAPFDDVNVRRAVVAGFSRTAARAARGGALVGDIPTHFLPPQSPGFDDAGGFPGPGVEYLTAANAGGDMRLAARYFRAAGFRSGRYEGHDEVLVAGANVDPGKAQALVAKAQLEKLGFRVRLRLFPLNVVFTDWCQVPARKVAMCGGVAWFKDFADPQAMLEPSFRGDQITRTGNINYSQLHDPRIDAAMRRAALLGGDERRKAWAQIDRMLVEAAAGVPFLWDKTTLIRSADVNGVASPYYAAWDLSFTSLTPR
jgi:peptide/nickel transport system substrate-binding protein